MTTPDEAEPVEQSDNRPTDDDGPQDVPQDSALDFGEEDA